ncbi:MAG TPA: hypothetical protein VLX32_09765 [Candidatus Acidoferrum sp.]|nr:hypothetical protein [Candidatus Acidoferrum sp.]
MTQKGGLAPEVLYNLCDPAHLPFPTTAELEDLGEILGQERAIEAVEFGLRMQRQGINLFLFGPVGTGEYPAGSLCLNRCLAGQLDGAVQRHLLRPSVGSLFFLEESLHTNNSTYLHIDD